MTILTKVGKKNPEVRIKAAELVAHLTQKDYAAEVQAIFNYVQNYIRYTRDIRGVETIQPAEYVLSRGTGDCDDKAVLLASMLESIGHPTRFVALGFRGNKFSHVLVESKIGNKWVALETTEPVRMGWYPPKVQNRLVIYN